MGENVKWMGGFGIGWVDWGIKGRLEDGSLSGRMGELVCCGGYGVGKKKGCSVIGWIDEELTYKTFLDR